MVLLLRAADGASRLFVSQIRQEDVDKDVAGITLDATVKSTSPLGPTPPANDFAWHGLTPVSTVQIGEQQAVA